MERLSELYGRVLDGMIVMASIILLVITFMIGFDVLLRNIGAGGIPPSNELSEYGLYLTTILAAPGLLRRGQHIRVDIILRAIPPRVAWMIEWIGDVTGIICSLFFIWYGVRVTMMSYAAGSYSIKTIVFPEWWIFAPLPICFLMVAVEFIFRMRQLALSDRVPRSDAISAS
jgi:TRAP-type C4-dicarboxylate transport system permease small subunit